MFYSAFIRYHIFILIVKGYAFPEREAKNISEHIWHSYNSNTGVGNREELLFYKIESKENIAFDNTTFQWKNLRIQGETLIIGLSENFISVTSFNGKNDKYNYKEDLKNPGKVFSVFQKWDVGSQSFESFVVVAVVNPNGNYLLKWYQIQQTKLKFLSEWSFYRNLTELDVIKINNELKLLILSHQKERIENPSVEIYSFNLTPELDLWLYEKIAVKEVPSSVSIFSDGDNTFLSASFKTANEVIIWRYSKTLCLQQSGEKHFNYHQKIFVNGVQSLISFRVGFQWHLAVASKNSSIYQIGENLLFHEVVSSDFGSLTYWFAVHIDNYREDVLLLSSSDSGISSVIWNPNQQLVTHGNFSKFVCRHDITCLRKMESISLNKTITFQQNNHQYLILSDEHNNQMFVKLLVKLKPLPDTVMLRLREILEEKDLIEKFYKSQATEIIKLIKIMEKFVKERSDPADSSSELSNPIKINEYLEIYSQIKNMSSGFETLNELKTKLDLILKKAKSVKWDSNEKDLKFLENYDTLSKTSNKFTFIGNVVIKKLDVSFVNGYDINEIFKDAYRKNKSVKIGGTKFAKNVNVENIFFDKVNNVLAEDILFTDDNWDDEDESLIINGDLHFVNNVQIINNLETNSGLPLKKNQSLTFDNISFENLEIINETNIQATVNSRPFILPIHNAPLDFHYLDTVKHPRIESIHVSDNVKVEFVNGKNLSKLIEQLNISNNNEPRQYDHLKVDGVFNAQDVRAQNINSIPLKFNDCMLDLKTNLRGSKAYSSSDTIQGVSKTSTNQENDLIISENIEPHFVDITSPESNITSENSEAKRIIHVYENLKINGSIYTKKLNNLNWILLNDTVRRGSEELINSKKTFKKPLKLKKIAVEGTVNGLDVKKILNKNSMQEIEFPLTLNNVKFKNLSLIGTWDGIYLNQLNESLVRLDGGNYLKTNFTCFEENELQIEQLNVKKSINDISLKKWNVYENENVSVNIIKGLKMVRASNIIVNGSVFSNNNINGVNLTNLFEKNINVNTSQVLIPDIHLDHLNVNGNLNVSTLNGYSIPSHTDFVDSKSLLADFLNGKIRKVNKLFVNGNITVIEGINGYNLSRLTENGVSIIQPIHIKENVTFEDTIYLGSLNLTGSMNGFNLKILEKDLIFKHGHVVLSGSKNFSNIKVLKDMTVRSINGHLVQDIVTKKGDQMMIGPVTINGNVIVKGNITSNEAINGVSIPKILKKFSPQYNAFIAPENLTLNSEKITINNLMVSGKIQNVPFDSFINNVISKKEAFNITGSKTFLGVVEFKKNLIVETTYNGLNMSQLFKDVVFVNEPSEIKGKLTIDKVTLNNIEVTDYFQATLINDLDLNELYEESIKIDEDEFLTGNMTFEKALSLGDIDVDFINNHISSAVIPLKGKQHIPVEGVFEKVHVTSDLDVGGLVNGRNLEEEFTDTLLVSGPQTIKGNYTFLENFVVNGNCQVRTVKDRHVNNLITLDTEQLLTRSLTFNGTVTILNNIEDLKYINNIDLKDWYTRAVLLNREQIINGSWISAGTITANNINGDALVDAEDFQEVAKKIKRKKMIDTQKKDEAQIDYFNQCHIVEEISKELLKLPYVFNQLDVVQIMETPSVIESVISFKIADSHYLITTYYNECWSGLYKWNLENSTFSYLKNINIGPVSKWIVSYQNNITYLITISDSGGAYCEESLQSGNIWVFEGDSDNYGHLFTTNAFADITQENNTSEHFYSIEENGDILQWTLQNIKSVMHTYFGNVGEGKYKFIDFKVVGGLAVSNGHEIKEIKYENETIKVVPFSIPHSIQIVALPREKKNLVAVVHKDKIVIYEDLKKEKIFTIVHVYKASSVIWFDYGFQRQAFLIVSSHHKLIEVYEYKSVSGFVRKISLQMFSMKLQPYSLPKKSKYHPSNFVLVIQKNKVVFIEANMMGDVFKHNNSFC